MFRTLRLAMLAGACAAGCAFAQPSPLKDLSLVDQRAQPLGAVQLAGHPTLLHFVFTTCSTTCPLQVAELAQVHKDLPPDVRAKVRFVSVTVDPLQDTPASLAAFAKRLDADRPGWYFATGPGAHPLAERMQVLNEKRPKPADHRTALYLFDARGTLKQRYGGPAVDRARLVAEITHVTRTR